MPLFITMMIFLALARAAELRIFLLAGQSNAEGQAEVATKNATTGAFLNGTLAYQLSDPRTAAFFASLWDAGRGNWTVWPTAKVWYNENGPQSGVNGSAIPSNSTEACLATSPWALAPTATRTSLAPSWALAWVCRRRWGRKSF